MSSRGGKSGKRSSLAVPFVSVVALLVIADISEPE